MKFKALLEDKELRQQYAYGLSGVIILNLLSGLVLPGIVPYLWFLQWALILPALVILLIVKRPAIIQGLLTGAALVFLLDTVICYGGFYPWMG